MKLLEAISPRVAAPFAIKLFFTTLKFKMPERELETFNQAIKTQLPIPDSEFTAYEWGESGTKILLVHGWSGRATQFFKISEALLKKGFHVFAIDAPGHGQSQQKQTNLFQFVQSIEVMGERFGPFKYAIGHSLGGMAIFNGLERNLKAEKVITIGTPDNIPNVVAEFCDKVGATSKVGNRIIAYIEDLFQVKTTEVSTDALAQKHNPPGLIFHDNTDNDVGVRAAKNLSKSWTNAELIITDGLGHRKVLMDEGNINKIIGFLS